MKLATALSERASFQVRLNELQIRLNANAKVQEGDVPAENPVELIAEKDRILDELENLVTRINLTNSRTECDGVTITELISKRDRMKKDVNIMRSFLNNASSKIDRYSKTEILIKSTVDISEYQKKLDVISKELRQIDEKIQELNWTTELI
ncbi:MAG: DIP1984 family protein [Ruminococcus sp.]|nr:DIP1984 family protein [Ruminococcus sp.]